MIAKPTSLTKLASKELRRAVAASLDEDRELAMMYIVAALPRWFDKEHVLAVMGQLNCNFKPDTYASMVGQSFAQKYGELGFWFVTDVRYAILHYCFSQGASFPLKSVVEASAAALINRSTNAKEGKANGVYFIEGTYVLFFTDPIKGEQNFCTSILNWRREPHYQYSLIRRFVKATEDHAKVGTPNLHLLRDIVGVFKGMFTLVPAEVTLDLCGRVKRRRRMPNGMKAFIEYCGGEMSLRLGAVGPAEDYARRAENAYKADEDRYGIGEAIMLRSRALIRRDAFEKAGELLKLSQRSFEAASREKAVLLHYNLFRVLQLRAEIELYRGNHKGAAARASVLLELAKQLGDVETTAHCRKLLGRLSSYEGRFAEALDHQSEALRIFEELSVRLGKPYNIQIGNALNSRAAVRLQELNSPGLLSLSEARTATKLAKEDVSRAGQLLVEINSTIGVANNRQLRAQLSLVEGDYKSALERSEEAEMVYRTQIERYGLANALLLKSEILLLKGNSRAAAKSIEEARKICLRYGARYDYFQRSIKEIVERVTERPGHQSHAVQQMFALLTRRHPKIAEYRKFLVT